jgi:HAE1 family hydrophobic/amphiphilic exporter-1
MGEFQTLKDIEKTLVNFYGNEAPIQVKDVAQVVDGLEEEKTRTFLNGESTLTLQVYRRSGSNTIAVVKAVKTRIEKINNDLQPRYKNFNVGIVRDDSKPIYANVIDVTESIGYGILLTVIVVFLFLGNVRSTVYHRNCTTQFFAWNIYFDGSGRIHDQHHDPARHELGCRTSD